MCWYVYTVCTEEYTRLAVILGRFESDKIVTESEYLQFFMYSSVSAALKRLSAADTANTSKAFPYLTDYVKALAGSDKVKSLSTNQVRALYIHTYIHTYDRACIVKLPIAYTDILTMRTLSQFVLLN